MQWSRIRGSGSDAAVLRAMARRDPRTKAWLKQTGIDRALLCSFEREPRFGRHSAKAVEPMADAQLADQFRVLVTRTAARTRSPPASSVRHMNK